MRCYIFDVDGTLADIIHRLHHIVGSRESKDWDAFFEACDGDAPIRHVCDLTGILGSAGEQIVLVSGRSDAVREKTEAWLDTHDVYYNRLYMRRSGDHRPDHVVKLELLAQIRADGYEPVMAFDDRTQVVKMWRAAGVPCAQVAEGDF